MDDIPEQSQSLELIQQSFGIPEVAQLLTLIILIIASGLVSGSEIAFFSLDPQQRKDLEQSKDKWASRILLLLEKPKTLLATILISNNFINVAIVLLSEVFFSKFVHFSDLNIDLFGGVTLALAAGTQEFLVNVILITFIILMFGEVIPKLYASRNAEKLCAFMSRPLDGAMRLLKPISALLINSTDIIEKRTRKHLKNVTVDELSHAIDLASPDEIPEEDQKILKGIVKFGNTTVRQIMTPRVDVEAYDLETTFEELIDNIVKHGFSRIPVYKESFDQIEGILYAKDLLPYTQEKEYPWTSLLKEPFYVPENKKIDDLLEEFQEKKIHLAIVVDEYGGSSGVVTMEDIIEEIVGDISDEFDQDDLVYSKLDENNFVFEAKTSLNDMYKVLGIDGEEFEEEKGESDSLAGFVLEQAGKIPKKGEKVRFERFLFTIEAADRRRVKRVKVTIGDEPIKGSFYALLVLLSLSLFSCSDDYTPKPRGYHRIDLPEPAYTNLDIDCPFTVEYNPMAKVEIAKNQEADCWFNLHYPKQHAKIHFSFFENPMDSIKTYIKDAHSLAMKHIAKAQNIEEHVIFDSTANVYGLAYDFEGSTASNIQFYLTDSSHYFVRGALYFETPPNPDSLAPVEKYIKEDIYHLIDSFEWIEKQ